MTKQANLLWDDRSGASAAEFAMVLPVLILFLLGTIDAGRIMWTWNKAEKATQMGVRMAAVTAPIPSGLASFSFVGTNGLTPGDTVPATAYGAMECGAATSVAAASCTCISGTCGWTTATSATSFAAVYDRMKLMLPELQRQNVKVRYSPSGFGFAGDPSGPNVYPLITVKLEGMTFKPLIARLFGTSVSLPSFSSTLTMEDGRGLASN